MNKNIWILIMGLFLFQACLDDEGNYSYSDLLPIEIDSSKMANSYRITQLDYLVVDPGRMIQIYLTSGRFSKSRICLTRKRERL